MATAPAAFSKPPVPVKASGSHFYKYGALAEPQQLERLRPIILEHQLYVPSLPQLNDPADGRPSLAQLSDDQMFWFLYNSKYGVLARNAHMPIDKQLLEAMTLDVNIRHYGADKLMRQFTDVLHHELDTWKVYCLCKRYNNMSMWAKYADDHRGYCLEFANSGPFFGSAKEMVYGDSVLMDITKDEHLNGWWFFCKSQEWSNEEEVRVLVPRQFPHLVKIEPQHLTHIILGRSMSDAHEKQIRECAKQRDPQLAVGKASWDSFKKELSLIA